MENSNIDYDLDNLEEQEIRDLISSLKKPQNLVDFNKMYNEISSTLFHYKIDTNQAIIDPGNNIDYVFHIFKSKFENRYSIHLRFKKNNIHLVRLDIGTGHTNPDSTVVKSDHIHIYANSSKYAKTYAIPIELSDFPVIQNFVEALNEFLSYTNIEINENNY